MGSFFLFKKHLTAALFNATTYSIMNENLDPREAFLNDESWDRWLAERQAGYPVPTAEDFAEMDDARNALI